MKKVSIPSRNEIGSCKYLLKCLNSITFSLKKDCV